MRHMACLLEEWVFLVGTHYLQCFVLLQKHRLTCFNSERLVGTDRADSHERTKASQFTMARRIGIQ